MTRREQNIKELLISSTTASALSFILCMILPNIETKADIFALFFPLWFLATVGIWAMFDIAERLGKCGR